MLDSLADKILDVDLHKTYELDNPFGGRIHALTQLRRIQASLLSNGASDLDRNGSSQQAHA